MSLHTVMSSLIDYYLIQKKVHQKKGKRENDIRLRIYIFVGCRNQYDISDICAKLFVPNPLYRDSTLNEINEDLIEIRNHRHC